MVRLKLAKKEDATPVASFFRELYDNSIYSKITKYKEEDVAELVEKVSDSPDTGVVILLVDNEAIVGAMICSYMNQIFNKEEKSAVEIAFWIKPEYKSISNLKSILGAYRYWAKQMGCTSILYGKLKNDSSVESYIVRKL